MRVALAEDGALFRDGLAMLLTAAGHDVVHCASDGDRIAELLATEPVDVTVLDIRMPPEPDGGLVTARRLRTRHPEMGLLLLSHYAETHYLAQVLEIGPARIGYRLKDRLSSVAALGDTLARIAAGELVIEPMLAARLVDHARDRRGELTALSEPELAVLRLMAGGLSNHGIAAELLVPRRSVEQLVGAIFAKLPLPADAGAYHRRVLAVLIYLRTLPIQAAAVDPGTSVERPGK